MAFTNSNDQITGRKPPRIPAGVDLVHERFTLTMATGDMALNTIGQVGVLPAGCIPVDVRIGGSDPDASTAALVMQVGVWDGSGASLSTAAADGGAHWGVSTAVTAASGTPRPSTSPGSASAGRLMVVHPGWSPRSPARSCSDHRVIHRMIVDPGWMRDRITLTYQFHWARSTAVEWAETIAALPTLPAHVTPF